MPDKSWKQVERGMIRKRDVNGRFPYRRWTPEDDRILRTMRSAGGTLNEIAAEVQRGEKAVGERVRRLRIAQPWKVPAIDLSRISALEAAYMAGFWDADGCFTIVRSKGRYQAKISVSNTNEKIIEWFAERIGTGSTARNHYATRSRKAGISFVVNRMADIVALINRIRPYLVGKRRQAEIVRDFCLARMVLPSRQDHFKAEGAMRDELQRLNRKGNRDAGQELETR